jgi:hypothetical protein
VLAGDFIEPQAASSAAVEVMATGRETGCEAVDDIEILQLDRLQGFTEAAHCLCCCRYYHVDVWMHPMQIFFENVP